MKKVLLIVFGSVAAVGIVLAIIGFAMGGWLGSLVFRNGQMSYENRHSQVDIGNAPGWFAGRSGSWYGWGWNTLDDGDWSASGAMNTEVTDSIDAPFTQAGNAAKVDIEIDAGYLTIQTGDEWNLEVRGPLAVTSEVEEGVWKLESKTNLDNIRTSSENWESRPRFYKDGVDITTDYILTVPEDMGELEASLDMGVMTVNGINMQRSDLQLDLGLMKVDGCTADRAAFTVDLGAAEITDFTARECTMDVNLGSIDYEGDVTELLDADCDLGGINCTLADPGEYGYDLKVGLGGISIDGQDMAYTTKDTVSGNPGTLPRYVLECDMGGIEINFQ